MSMATQNVAPVLGPDVRAIIGTAAEVKKPRKRVYKARVATKVKWALGDAMERNLDAQKRIQRFLDYVEELQAIAEASQDITLMSLIAKMNLEAARLAGGLAEQERTLTGAIAESKPEVKEKSKYSEL
jgi:hypothetical protein